MIHLRLLGGRDLRSAEGAEVLSVLAQPKRFALLAWLAVEGTTAPRSRDAALAMFWPELDVERARPALNNALYHLRRSLGAQAIVSRGTEEIGVDADRIHCDATAFEALLREDRAAAALDLYRGELLEGFYLAGAPDFERWLDQRRESLREAARGAALGLSVREESAGRHDQALHWGRRAQTIAPYDERATRQVIRLLQTMGDRAGAVQEYNRFAGMLRDELGLEPSAETGALVRSLREAGPAAGARDATAPMTAAVATSSPESPVARIPTSHAAPGARGWRSAGWRRAGVLVAALVALVAAIPRLAERRDATNRHAAGSAAAPAVVAVLPFAVRGDSSLSYLAEGLVDLLSARLGGPDDVRTVDPRALLNFARGGSSDDPAAAVRAVASRFGAGYAVMGSAVQLGAGLQLTASLYSTGGGDTPIARAAATGAPAELSLLVDEVARQLLPELARTGTGADHRFARTTTSLAALQAYLDGTRHARAGRYLEAEQAFQRAVQADSTFAMAYYAWSNAADWTGQYTASQLARRAALRHSDGLTAHDRLVLEAWSAHSSGDPGRAEPLYRAALRARPDDVEAWLQLSELIFHWGTLAGRPVTEAREGFEKVAFLEPGNAGALMHLARIAATTGDTIAVDTLTAAVLRLQPSPAQGLEMRLLRAGLVEPQLWPAVLDGARLASGGASVHLLTVAAAHGGDLAAAAELGRAMREGSSPDAGLELNLHVAIVEAARGRTGAAMRELDRISRDYPARAREIGAVIATLPFLDIADGDRRGARRALPAPELTADRFTIGPTSGHMTANTIYPPRALYLDGMLSARTGDTAAAGVARRRLEQDPPGNELDADFSHRFARIMAGDAAFAERRFEDALALVSNAAATPDSILVGVLSYPFAHERWLRAEALRELGRHRDALRVYESFPDPTAYDLMYVPAALLRRAAIHEHVGEAAEALRLYRRAARLLRDADDAAAALARTARDGVQRLAAGN